MAFLYDDTYQGPRFTYGLSYRPLRGAHVPARWILNSDRAHPAFKFGTVDFPELLSEQAVARFELTGPINVAPAESSA